MNVEFNKIDSSTANLVVSIAKEDYFDKYNEELAKHKNKAQLKGFRKGKTPMSYIQKMFGDQVLTEIINGISINGLYDHIKQNDIKIILDPILDDEDIQSVNHKDLGNFSFTFKVALAQDFEIKGIDASESYTKYKVIPDKGEMDENFQKIATQLGENQMVTDSIQEKDIVTLLVDVLLTDEEGLTEPIEAEIKVLVSDTTLEFQEKTKALKLNDSLKIKLSNIEAKDIDFIKKYYLNLEDGDTSTFEDEVDASIYNVQRIAPMEVGEDMFKKIFPDDEIKTKEEAYAKLAENTSKEHEKISSNLVYRKLMDNMMDNTVVEINEDFVLAWGKKTKNIKEGTSDEDFKEFFSKELKWMMIKSKLIEKYEVKLEQPEIKAYAKEQVMGYFGYKGAENEEYVNMIAENVMKDEEQMRKMVDELMTGKMYKAMEQDLTFVEEEKSVKEFYAIVEELNNKLHNVS